MEPVDGFANSLQNIFRSGARKWHVASAVLRTDEWGTENLVFDGTHCRTTSCRRVASMDRPNCASPSARTNGGAFPIVPGDAGGDAVSSSGCGVVPARSDCIPLACIRGPTEGFELATVLAGC